LGKKKKKKKVGLREKNKRALTTRDQTEVSAPTHTRSVYGSSVHLNTLHG
jgi:hypothetical protein